MDETSFNLVFEGGVEPGHNQDGVRCILESLFEFDAENQVDFFSGNPVVLGENLNAMTARSFKQALTDAGITTLLLAANDKGAKKGFKSRRLGQRRINTERRARIRTAAFVPDRREGLGRRP